MRALQKRIAFLSIFEIGYCALGRGDAERSECSPFWRVPSLTNVACRVAIKATALRLMAPGSRCDTQWHPRKRPTVGAGSSRFSRRFPRPPDSPYAKIPPPTVPAAQTLPPPPSPPPYAVTGVLHTGLQDSPPGLCPRDMRAIPHPGPPRRATFAAWSGGSRRYKRHLRPVRRAASLLRPTAAINQS